MTKESFRHVLDAERRLTYRCKESERRQECLFSEHCFLGFRCRAAGIAHSDDASNN